MSVRSMTKPETSARPGTLRAHALGLLGANLAIGALFLWALPVAERIAHSPEGFGLTWAHLLQPWADWGHEMPVPPQVCAALTLAGMIGGVLLLLRAARLLGEATERR